MIDLFEVIWQISFISSDGACNLQSMKQRTQAIGLSGVIKTHNKIIVAEKYQYRNHKFHVKGDLIFSNKREKLREKGVGTMLFA